MATRQCHTCKYNGKGNKACLTCNTNVAPRRSVVSIDVHPWLADKLIMEQRTPPPQPLPKELEEKADFLREWLYLPSKQRDVFAALYVFGFNLAAAALFLKVGARQLQPTRNQLAAHPYFQQFFPANRSGRKTG